MTAEPEGPIPNTVEIGSEKAVVVPMDEYRRLKALERHATAEALEEAEIEAAITAHDEWVAAGRPGEMSHEEFMAEMFGSAQ